ncbi:MAG: PspA/IM30 family protein [Limnothrix sp. RL_2_0]|nr:PspA/IM30 family protein [Limnothrix sp. RL_2_0]
MGFLGRTLSGMRQGVQRLFLDEENPEVILEQALWDMEKKLIQMRRAVAQAVASFKRADRQRQQALISVQRWQNRAQMALSYGDEALAKEAIARSRDYDKVAKTLVQQGQEQQTFIADVRKNLRHLEEQINQIKMQKEMYVARIRSAVAQQELHRLKEELELGHLQPAIADLEADMWQIEAETYLTDSLEAKFIALEKHMAAQE